MDRRRVSSGEAAFMIGVPLAWAVLLLFHPSGEADEVYVSLQDQVTEGLVVHIGMLIFIPLMAAVIYLLLRGVEGTAAPAFGCYLRDARGGNPRPLRTDRADARGRRDRCDHLVRRHRSLPTLRAASNAAGSPRACRRLATDRGRVRRLRLEDPEVIRAGRRAVGARPDRQVANPIETLARCAKGKCRRKGSGYCLSSHAGASRAEPRRSEPRGKRQP